MPLSPLRFGIDNDLDEAELGRREAYERMFRRAHASLLNIDAIDAVMKAQGFFNIWSHLDATVEYVRDGSADETAVFFQRDWSKAGFLRAPYRMCIAEPGVGKFYYRVRSLLQLRRVLARWELKQDRSKPVKLRCKWL